MRPAAASARGPRSPGSSVRPYGRPGRRRPAGPGGAGRGRRSTPEPPLGARPPTTEVPPPNGTTATRCPAQARSTASDLVVTVGQHHGVGRVGDVAPPRTCSRSGVDLPRVWRTRLSSSVRTLRLADRPPRGPARAAGVSREAATSTSDRAGGGGVDGLDAEHLAQQAHHGCRAGAPPWPDRPSRSRACLPSPPDHPLLVCRARSRRVAPPRTLPSRPRRYTVTHDVYSSQ